MAFWASFDQIAYKNVQESQTVDLFVSYIFFSHTSFYNHLFILLFIIIINFFFHFIYTFYSPMRFAMDFVSTFRFFLHYHNHIFFCYDIFLLFRLNFCFPFETKEEENERRKKSNKWRRVRHFEYAYLAIRQMKLYYWI